MLERLCFLNLSDIRGYLWNHERVYRIYRELELDLRIKPKQCIVRERLEVLVVPAPINQTGSTDFMQHARANARSHLLLNVTDD